jgi:Ca2+-binding RTX toxin-like protein
LGAVKNGVLTLNMGTRASDRLYLNTEDAAESVILSGMDAGVVDVEFLGFHKRFTGVTQVVVDMGQGNDSLDASRLLNAVTLDVRGNEGNDTVKLGKGGGRVVDLLGDNNLSAFAESDAGVTFITGLGNDKLTGGRGNDVLFAGAGNNQLTGGAGGDTLYAVMGQNRLVGGEGADRYVFVGELGNNTLSEGGTDATDLDFSGGRRAGGLDSGAVQRAA